MGTGKSSVGRQTAAYLGFEFVDTDEMIEDRADCRITEIFAREGEARFRAYEAELVQELAKRRKLVISTGGGLIVNPANLAALKTYALVVCLWAEPESIWQRVRHQSHRPLLQNPDPLGKIRELLAAREPAYRQADVLINTELRSVSDVAHQVVHQYRLAQRATHTP